MPKKKSAQSAFKDATIRTVSSINDIVEADWDGCAAPGGAVAFNPFVTHAFLKALEDSGSASAEEGWTPVHLALEQGGSLLGVLPMYAKTHSYGEYVFDWGWADAFERAGGRYYPKLQASVPFTPATGRRLLTRPGPQESEVRRLLIEGGRAVTSRLGVSSLHVTFMPEDEWKEFGDLGFLQRQDRQFHWQNDDYGSFEDFLTCLASRKRKTLKKERAAALENDIEIEWVTGSDLTEAHWDAFYVFYCDTGARKWGQPYLTRAFFSQVGETMADHILLIMCKRNGRYIAGALNFIGGDTLFGRHWGAIEDHRFLHFEACYYQAIDFAIDRKLTFVEAGAQGAHKLARGYLPRPTYSAHWIENPSLREAIAEYLEMERAEVSCDIEALSEHAPFKKETPDTGDKT